MSKLTGQERITACFAQAQEQGHKAFIPFITCGDPDLATTRNLVNVMVQNGATMIELGIPFSEYANVVFSYHKGDETADSGTECFVKRAAQAGIDGLILPDVPFEEKDEFEEPAHKYGLALISMIAPTSHERIAKIAQSAHGFIYVVSSLGVTGTRTKFSSDLASVVATIKQYTKLPCAIGFGISTPEQATAMGKLAEGAIVGSAIVKLIAVHKQAAPEVVGPYVKSMVEALKI